MKKLPVGIDDFKEIVQNNYYYIDKTKFIEAILNDRGKFNFLFAQEGLERLLICLY